MAIVAPPPPEKAAAFGVRSAYRNSGISKDGLSQIQKLSAEGILKPFVRKIFPLAQASQAHALGERGHGRGKILLGAGEAR